MANQEEIKKFMKVITSAIADNIDDDETIDPMIVINALLNVIIGTSTRLGQDPKEVLKAGAEALDDQDMFKGLKLDYEN